MFKKTFIMTEPGTDGVTALHDRLLETINDSEIVQLCDDYCTRVRQASDHLGNTALIQSGSSYFLPVVCRMTRKRLDIVERMQKEKSAVPTPAKLGAIMFSIAVELFQLNMQEATSGADTATLRGTVPSIYLRHAPDMGPVVKSQFAAALNTFVALDETFQDEIRLVLTRSQPWPQQQPVVATGPSPAEAGVSAACTTVAPPVTVEVADEKPVSKAYFVDWNSAELLFAFLDKNATKCLEKHDTKCCDAQFLVDATVWSAFLMTNPGFFDCQSKDPRQHQFWVSITHEPKKHPAVRDINMSFVGPREPQQGDNWCIRRSSKTGDVRLLDGCAAHRQDVHDLMQEIDVFAPVVHAGDLSAIEQLALALNFEVLYPYHAMEKPYAASLNTVLQAYKLPAGLEGYSDELKALVLSLEPIGLVSEGYCFLQARDACGRAHLFIGMRGTDAFMDWMMNAGVDVLWNGVLETFTGSDHFRNREEFAVSHVPEVLDELTCKRGIVTKDMEVHVYGHSMGGHRGHLLAALLLDDPTVVARVKSIDGLFLNSGGFGLIRNTHLDRLRHVNTIGDFFLNTLPGVGANTHKNQLRLLLPGVPLVGQQPVGAGLFHGHESRHGAAAIRQFSATDAQYWTRLRNECNQLLTKRGALVPDNDDSWSIPAWMRTDVAVAYVFDKAVKTQRWFRDQGARIRRFFGSKK